MKKTRTEVGHMSSAIRFIHSADLHLDSLFKTKGDLPAALLEKLRASTFEAFDRLIEACLYHEVDFLLIAGDLYNEEMRSLKAQVHLRRGFERLEEKGIHVFMGYGNHDYTKGAKYPITFPDHVHIFSGETVESFVYEKKGEQLARIYGFSYENREVRGRKVQEYQPVGNSFYHIAMLHGSLETNTDHDVYAPFSMEELKNKGMDYWALGHIHKRESLSDDPPIIYPGNIQGRSRKEPGEKGCYLIEHQEGIWTTEFLPLHSFTYEAARASCDHIEEPQELEGVLEEIKKRFLKTETAVMLTITLSSKAGKLRYWWMEGIVQEWMDLVNEAEDLDRQDWVWVEQIIIEDRPAWNEEELVNSHHFTGELLRTVHQVDEEQLEEWLTPLFSHRKVSKYVQPLSEEEKQEAIEMAKSLTVERLLGSEGGNLENS
ncbi:DNA repair exonuclease [Halobacillus litoralis]|uniref:DNA repair exonuclease n=2 Tax=Halobacillus litoralis TaxID=45668 RepID=A0A410MAK9_9BACI|nr:DNA repair exonuclease [Halobacillus litoralis]